MYLTSEEIVVLQEAAQVLTGLGRFAELQVDNTCHSFVVVTTDGGFTDRMQLPIYASEPAPHTDTLDDLCRRLHAKLLEQTGGVLGGGCEAYFYQGSIRLSIPGKPVATIRFPSTQTLDEQLLGKGEEE